MLKDKYYYNNINDAKKSKRICKCTNKRYNNFNQRIYTVGDTQQFFELKNKKPFFKSKEVDGKKEEEELKNNLFLKSKINIWCGFENLNESNIDFTFKYIFNKFKKGIYIKILNNKIESFIPFSKHRFCNEFVEKIKVKNNNFHSFLKKIHMNS